MKRILTLAFVALLSLSSLSASSREEITQQRTAASIFRDTTPFMKTVHASQYIGSDVELYGLVLVDQWKPSSKVGTLMVAQRGYDFELMKGFSKMGVSHIALFVDLANVDSLVMALKMVASDMQQKPEDAFSLDYVVPGGFGFHYNNQTGELFLNKYVYGSAGYSYRDSETMSEHVSLIGKLRLYKEVVALIEELQSAKLKVQKLIETE